MVKTRNAIILVVAVVATAGILSTTAFTSASMDRSVSIDVVQDDSGPLSLVTGNAGWADYTTSGQLEVTSQSSDYSGINTASTYTIGDSSSPSDANVFKIVNNDGSAHDITLDESINGVSFTLVNGGTTQSTPTDDSTSSVTASSVASGSTVYVTMKIDTTGDSFSKGDTISGDLSVSASAATTAN